MTYALLDAPINLGSLISVGTYTMGTYNAQNFRFCVSALNIISYPDVNIRRRGEIAGAGAGEHEITAGLGDARARAPTTTQLV